MEVLKYSAFIVHYFLSSLIFWYRFYNLLGVKDAAVKIWRHSMFKCSFFFDMGITKSQIPFPPKLYKKNTHHEGTEWKIFKMNDQLDLVHDNHQWNKTTSMLSAKGILGRALVRARFCTNIKVAVQCRITNGHHIQPRNFQRGALCRRMLYKEYVARGVYQTIVRRQSDGRSPERKQILLKRMWRILAGFLLLHFLWIYFYYKYKRKGGPVHRTPPYAIETRWDHDLKRRFTIINGYMLPDFINKRSYNDIYNFKVHPDDVYVVSFPKSGKFSPPYPDYSAWNELKVHWCPPTKNLWLTLNTVFSWI